MPLKRGLPVKTGASEISPKHARSAMQRQFGCLGLSLLSACPFWGGGSNHKLDFVMQPDRIADERLGRLYLKCGPYSLANRLAGSVIFTSRLKASGPCSWAIAFTSARHFVGNALQCLAFGR